MNVTVALSYAYSNETWFGMSWSCRRGLARISAAESPSSIACTMFCTVAVIIRLPPAEPAIRNRVPLGWVTIAGVIDDKGRFPGRI